MRVVLDLQVCQVTNHLRGVGRYSLSLAKAIVQHSTQHEIWILLSDLFPDTVELIRNEFASLLHSERIVVIALPATTTESAGNAWRARAAELIREHAISELRPDVVHIGGLLERGSIVTAKVLDQTPIIAATHYDLHRYLRVKSDACGTAADDFFQSRIETLKQVDLLLATSRLAAEQASNEWHIDSNRIADISVQTGDTNSSLESKRGEHAVRAFEQAVSQRQVTSDAVPQQASSLYESLLSALARIEAPAGESDRVAAASSIAHNLRRNGQRQLLVDVSQLSDFDAKAGIQRVTRAVVMRLLGFPVTGWVVRLVRVDDREKAYRYADGFSRSLGFPVAEVENEDDWVDAGAGDLFLGLDLCTDMVPAAQSWFQGMRRKGVAIYFVVYDLLPVQRPEWFSDGLASWFPHWLQTIGEVSDGLIGISRAVVDDLYRWYGQRPPQRRSELKLGYFHLGADIHSTNPSVGLETDAEKVLAQLRSRPSFLMVGTVEPRKGHEQVLAAFDQLWKKGVCANLVVVGKPGWLQERLISDMKDHPQCGVQLFWLQGVSDEYLEKVYEASSCLLAASEGEGFGLPLIEAAQKRVPIIARNLPVFREIAGEHACYFEGGDPMTLAKTIEGWLKLSEQGRAPLSSNLNWLTWAQSVEQLKAVMFDSDWVGFI